MISVCNDVLTLLFLEYTVDRVGLQQRSAVAAQLGQVIGGVNEFLDPGTLHAKVRAHGEVVEEGSCIVSR